VRRSSRPQACEACLNIKATTVDDAAHGPAVMHKQHDPDSRLELAVRGSFGAFIVEVK
jgi:hypothetical protein